MTPPRTTPEAGGQTRHGLTPRCALGGTGASDDRVRVGACGIKLVSKSTIKFKSSALLVWGKHGRTPVRRAACPLESTGNSQTRTARVGQQYPPTEPKDALRARQAVGGCSPTTRHARADMFPVCSLRLLPASRFALSLVEWVFIAIRFIFEPLRRQDGSPVARQPYAS